VERNREPQRAERPHAVDYLIVGAGPAGLQLAYFLERSGRDYVVLERGSAPGTFFERYPRHRQLISINKVHTGSADPEFNLRHDWNSLLHDDDDFRFPRYSSEYYPPASALLEYLHDFGSRTGVAVRYGSEVSRIGRDAAGDRFVVTTADRRRYDARVVIVATGRHTERELPADGAASVDSYGGASVDPAEFCGKSVLIVGMGNSAFETADNLIPTAARIHIAGRRLNFAWQTRFVGDLRAVNNNVIDTYHLKSGNALIFADISRIEHRDGRYAVTFDYLHAVDETPTREYDRVIMCVGFRFDDSIFAADCAPRTVHEHSLPEQTADWESVNVPGLYFAGTLMQARDYHRANSGFIHGFRYNVRALERIFAAKYHGEDWPARSIRADAGTLALAILERVNRTSGLWQQFGFLCDVIRLGAQEADWLEELPLDLAADFEGRREPQSDRRLLLTFEVPRLEEDPFALRFKRDPLAAPASKFVHPVVRFYCDGRLEATHHVSEDLHAEWHDQDLHVRPLTAFLERCMQARERPQAVRA
jgi:thioredoxin reductase